MIIQYAKPPISLVDKNNPHEVLAYACGACRQVFATYREAAQHCPKAIRCDCGKRLYPDVPRYQTLCVECSRKAGNERRRKAAEERRDNAVAAGQTVECGLWVGPVYWEEKDRFFASVEDAVEAVKDDAPKESLQEVFLRSQTLWTCTTEYLSLDADVILESTIEAMEPPDGVEIDPGEKAVTELRDFVKRWNAEHGVNAGEVWWEGGHLIVFDEEEQ